MRFTILTIILFFQVALVTASASESAVEVAIDSARNSQKDFIACEGGCPEYLGLMTLYTNVPTDQDVLKFSKCLATLIAPDEILTNAHCVPSAHLQKYIRVIFPSSKSHPANSVKVLEVLQLNDSDKNPLLDYAILKLDRVLKRDIVRISQGNVSKNQSLTVYTHVIHRNAQTGLNFLLLKPQTCTAIGESMANDKHNLTLKLDGCTTIQGDSGGPILTSSGDLAGVVWGGNNTTLGLNANCLPGPSGDIPLGKCFQEIDIAAFRKVQSLTNNIFAFEKYGRRSPVSHEVPRGKLYFNALGCFSQIPAQPFKMQMTALFIPQKILDTFSVPLEASIPTERRPVTIILQPEGKHLQVQVLNKDGAPMALYMPLLCMQ